MMACAMFLFQDSHHCTHKLMSVGSQHEELRGSPQCSPSTALSLPHSLSSLSHLEGQIVTRPQRHPLSLSTSILQMFCDPGTQCSCPSLRDLTWLRQSPTTEATMGHQGGQYSTDMSKRAARWQGRAAGRIQTDLRQKSPNIQGQLCAWVRNSAKLSGAGRFILTNVGCGGGVQMFTLCASQTSLL